MLHLYQWKSHNEVLFIVDLGFEFLDVLIDVTFMSAFHTHTTFKDSLPVRKLTSPAVH